VFPLPDAGEETVSCLVSILVKIFNTRAPKTLCYACVPVTNVRVYVRVYRTYTYDTGRSVCNRPAGDPEGTLKAKIILKLVEISDFLYKFFWGRGVKSNYLRNLFYKNWKSNK